MEGMPHALALTLGRCPSRRATPRGWSRRRCPDDGPRPAGARGRGRADGRPGHPESRCDSVAIRKGVSGPLKGAVQTSPGQCPGMIGASRSLILANDNSHNLCPDRAKPVPGMPQFLSPFQGSGELERGRDLHPQGVALGWSVRPLRGRKGRLGSPLTIVWRGRSTPRAPCCTTPLPTATHSPRRSSRTVSSPRRPSAAGPISPARSARSGTRRRPRPIGGPSTPPSRPASPIPASADCSSAAGGIRSIPRVLRSCRGSVARRGSGFTGLLVFSVLVSLGDPASSPGPSHGAKTAMRRAGAGPLRLASPRDESSASSLTRQSPDLRRRGATHSGGRDVGPSVPALGVECLKN